MGLIKSVLKQIAYFANDKVTEQQLQKNKKLKKAENMLMEE